MEWSPDGNKIAAATRSYIAFRDPKAVNQSGIDGNGRSFYSISWSPNSLYLASGNSAGQVQIWNVETFALAYEIETRQEAIYAVDWSPDGTRLAYGGTDGRLEIRAVAVTPPTAEITLDTEIYDVEWSPDGTLIAVATSVGVTLLDNTLNEIDLLTAHTTEVRSVSWNPDGTKLASAGGTGDSSIKIWDRQISTNTFTLNTSITTDYDYLVTVDWSPDGTRLAESGIYLDVSVDGNLIGRVNVRETTTWTQLSPDGYVINNPIPHIAWSNDSSSMVISGAVYTRGSLSVINSQTVTGVFNLTGNTTVNAFDISSDGYIALDVLSEIGIVSVDNGNVLGVINSNPINAIRWKPGERWFAYSYAFGLDVIDYDTQAILKHVTLPSVHKFIAWHPTDMTILTATRAGLIQLWDVSDAIDPSGTPTITPYPTRTQPSTATPTP